MYKMGLLYQYISDFNEETGKIKYPVLEQTKKGYLSTSWDSN